MWSVTGNVVPYQKEQFSQLYQDWAKFRITVDPFQEGLKVDLMVKNYGCSLWIFFHYIPSFENSNSTSCL